MWLSELKEDTEEDFGTASGFGTVEPTKRIDNFHKISQILGNF